MVRRGGVPVAATPKEFDLLVFFRGTGYCYDAGAAARGGMGLRFRGGNPYSGHPCAAAAQKAPGLQGALTTIPKLGYRLER